MFEHLVSFKFNENYTKEHERKLLDKIATFKAHIPGIVEITAGVNTTGETEQIQGYTLGLRVTFQDEEALRAYGPHPVHREYVQMLDGIIDNVIVIDYEITT